MVINNAALFFIQAAVVLLVFKYMPSKKIQQPISKKEKVNVDPQEPRQNMLILGKLNEPQTGALTAMYNKFVLLSKLGFWVQIHLVPVTPNLYLGLPKLQLY